jgi:phage gp29-like protein
VAVQIYSQKNNSWRDAYNPIRGMTLARLLSLFDAGERGAYADLQWFFYFMERSDPMIYAVLQRRHSTLLSSDWDIRVVDGPDADKVLAQEQAAFLRESYERIQNLREAISFMFSGLFRGYAHLEKHYTDSGLIQRLEPVEQWFWVRDGMFGDWAYNKGACGGLTRGQRINKTDFLILEAVALNRLLALQYIARTLTLKDWDAFLEVYGIPSVFLVGPPNTSDTKAAEYQAIAEQLISDGRGYLPNGSDIKYINGGGNAPPFRERLEYLDRQITLVATGGLLTMLTQSGSGTLAGTAHTETFMQIARSDAAMLSEVFQRDFDTPLLSQFFPGQPIHAYFQFAPTTGTEVSRVVADAETLARAGVAIDLGELSEKTGYKLTAMKTPLYGEAKTRADVAAAS